MKTKIEDEDIGRWGKRFTRTETEPDNKEIFQ